MNAIFWYYEYVEVLFLPNIFHMEAQYQNTTEVC